MDQPDRAEIFDARQCELGEGPIWHPGIGRFFWFDILNRRLYSRGADGPQEWHFDRMASAAGWIDDDRLMIGTETGLGLLTLSSGQFEDLAPIEANNPATRSNDGRADRQGGFWLGTMGKAAEAGHGSIWRYHRGEIRRLVEGITIPNAICFSPDGKIAYYADTVTAQIWAQPLDDMGWPAGERRLFLNLTAQGLNPDGAVTDSEGALCVACWGVGAVIRFSPDGQRLDEYRVGGSQSSCPAFGGKDMRDMLVTTAYEGMESPDAPQGLTYLTRTMIAGLAEPQVIL